MTLSIDGSEFKDEKGRTIFLRGVNLGGDSKLPAHPDGRSHIIANFFDGDNVSFIGRPFSIEGASEHLRRLKMFGYNVVRLPITWEAVEHEKP